jgi:hypothetical protein
VLEENRSKKQITPEAETTLKSVLDEFVKSFA